MGQCVYLLFICLPIDLPLFPLIFFYFRLFPCIPALQLSSATRKLQLGFFGTEISEIAAPNSLNFRLLSSILSQIHRLILINSNKLVILLDMEKSNKIIENDENISSNDGNDSRDDNNRNSNNKNKENKEDNENNSRVNIDNNIKNATLLYDMQFCLLRTLRANVLRLQEQQKSADEIGLIYFPLNSQIRNDGNVVNNGYSHLTVFRLLLSVLRCISGERTMRLCTAHSEY